MRGKSSRVQWRIKSIYDQRIKFNTCHSSRTIHLQKQVCAHVVSRENMVFTVSKVLIFILWELSDTLFSSFSNIIDNEYWRYQATLSKTFFQCPDTVLQMLRPQFYKFNFFLSLKKIPKTQILKIFHTSLNFYFVPFFTCYWVFDFIEKI